MQFADIIIDISHYKLDQVFEYIIPEHLCGKIKTGMRVHIPFGMGNRKITGYVTGCHDMPSFDVTKMKEILGVVEGSIPVSEQLLMLAIWMKDCYGGTLNEAIKTVMPVKSSTREVKKCFVFLETSREKAKEQSLLYEKKRALAKKRLLDAVRKEEGREWKELREETHVAKSVLGQLCEEGVLVCKEERVFRNPAEASKDVPEGKKTELNPEQAEIARHFLEKYKKGVRDVNLLHGVTGSGKTEVYMEIMEEVIKEGKEVILLIPEIALTYQTMNRFRARFGKRIAISHSRLSKGERFDQYEQAENGEVSIMIGTRSALFTPFQNLGLIIMDEEHESSYKSENVPRYHARETAIERARLCGASVLLGSATPTLESYQKVKEGKYHLYELKKRAGSGRLPKISVVDLREEFRGGNYSMFSGLLREKLSSCLLRKEQAMLFMNRRGFAHLVSCRSCGTVIKCPHCDISLTFHKGKEKKLFCHYCGYQERYPAKCPACDSPHIGSFGSGTQKVEEALKREFPAARVLRMDADTTKGKHGHEEILSAFSKGEADIVVGTQMIVKGHDFPNVTLMGILAADLSLYAQNYRAVEQTFELLVQAAGRAGRGEQKGEVVIQTYNPQHYGIQYAVKGDYEGFFQKEIAVRKSLLYPPASHMLAVLIEAPKQENAKKAGPFLMGKIKHLLCEERFQKIMVNGPMEAGIGKMKDQFRERIYFRMQSYECLKEIKDALAKYTETKEFRKYVLVQYDFDPLRSD